MYDQVIIGIIGAAAGYLFSSRVGKSDLDSLKGDMLHLQAQTSQIVQETNCITTDYSRIGATLNVIRTTTDESLGDLKKMLINEKLLEEKEVELSELREEYNNAMIQAERELEEETEGLRRQLAETQQLYVEMANKANAEIEGLRSTVKNYHEALTETAKQNQELAQRNGVPAMPKA